MKNRNYTLYFFKDGRRRKIAEICRQNKDMDEILKEAGKLYHAFCEERSFKIHHVRVWNEDGATVFDVGSHTEFFHLVPEVNFSEQARM